MQTFGYLISNILLTILTIVLTGWIITHKRILPAHKKLTIILLASTALVTLCQFVVATTDVSGFPVWFFNMDDDRNVPAAYSAVVWIILVVLLIQHGRNPALPILQRVCWWIFALVFLWIAVDDFYAIHEKLIDEWLPIYLAFAAIVAAIGIFVFFMWLLPDFRQRPMPFIIMAIGVVVLGYSAFYLEAFTWGMCEEPIGRSLCRNLYLLRTPDEVFELIAPIFIIVGFGIYIYPMMDEQRWQQTNIAWVLTSIASVVIMGGFFYPLPVLEQRILSQPVQVQYGDEVELIGYWIDNPNPQPGDRINVILYWQTPNRVRERYSMAVHLLSYPTQQSYAQADPGEIGQIPQSAWFPGFIVRGAVHLNIPEDIPTPASYTISVRVGQDLGLRDEAQGLTITDSTLDTLYEDTIALTRIPIVDNSQTQSVATSSVSTFADNITLVGYDLPAQINAPTLPVMLQWEVQKPGVGRTYTQFFHIYDGDTFVFGYDEPPFNHHFPTADWPRGANLTYDFNIPLPSDLPAGEYHIFTGMYDSETMQRLEITSSDRQVQDHIIELGNFSVVP